MKKTIFFIPLLIGVFLAVFGYFWWQNAISAPSQTGDKVRFVITKGTSAEKIGRDLAEKDLIKSAFAFKLYTQLNNLTHKIPPGEFLLPRNLELEDLLIELMRGPEEYWVTIPEGLRREEIAEKFASDLGLKDQEAISFRDDFLLASRNIEGFLFPDSYLFPPDVTAEVVVDRLESTFYSKIGEDYQDLVDQTGYSLRQVVTLASIVERETLTDEERPIVAGIFYNRLNIGMPLQADATLQYATGTKRCSNGNSYGCDWWITPLAADKSVDSPFNTYQIQGIPPAPIANPGLSSLMAVVKPQETDYLYYIHDEDGQIYYAQTLDQHNENVQKYLR